MLEIYGIKNCNTVKKALDWLIENQLEYNFHDYKKEPATEKQLLEWEKTVDWKNLINKKGTTWKKLSAEQQAEVVDANTANKVLLGNNSMIKRPLILYPGGILLGFDEVEYNNKLL